MAAAPSQVEAGISVVGVVSQHCMWSVYSSPAVHSSTKLVLARFGGKYGRDGGAELINLFQYWQNVLSVKAMPYVLVNKCGDILLGPSECQPQWIQKTIRDDKTP
jgi:hypothetical protein